MADGCKLPVVDEKLKEQAMKEWKENMKWAKSLTKEQINFLCDGGWYNNTMEGYLRLSAKNAGFKDDDIRKLIAGLKDALEWYDKEAADAESKKLL
ncbi:MAG: hypothetical protein IKN85_10385 [Oscillospiraceae bacterium]|nr:hypothetical protein [Oscillospiraceae bacterium]MBR3536221.1 hypothetical protein [Oscillospiraceae bacterium]MBR6923540.1 hypothetical protein [Oscillospiraceae bacterium]